MLIKIGLPMLDSSYYNKVLLLIGRPSLVNIIKFLAKISNRLTFLGENNTDSYTRSITIQFEYIFKIREHRY